MANESDEDRIRRKAHELWEADGRPQGRDEAHWVQAREIIAIEDSQGDTLLPRDTGASEPIEDADEALRNLADFPNLTDQGENLLTSTDREPSFGAGDTPSIGVPTSDQPGIPETPHRVPSKPDRDMKASEKASSEPQPIANATASSPAKAPETPAPSSKPSKGARRGGPATPPGIKKS